MRPYLVNQANYLETVPSSERAEPETKLPSQTVPGQVLELDEVLARYTRGQDVQVFTPQYDGEEDEEVLPANLHKLDKVERAELARTTSVFMQNLRNKLIERKKQREQPKPDPKPDQTPDPDPDPDPDPKGK